LTDFLQHQITISQVPMVALLGTEDKLLKTLEASFPKVDVLARGNEIVLSGPASEVEQAGTLVSNLIELIQSGSDLGESEVTRSANIVRSESSKRPAEVLGQSILSTRGKTIRAKTVGQRAYIDAIDSNTVVFGIGPAGTGKTYLAMAKAVQALQRKEVSRIILTRPAVEAGERLGFLPGSLSDKIDPYLRPLFDALHEMLDPEAVPKLMAAGTIEVAPLAYMRGRTLNDAFIILDEAQNSTQEQLKMFLTRLGFNSKMVITGDSTQIDLPRGVSGLKNAERILGQVEGVVFVELESEDVVRHELVSEIVDAYDDFNKNTLDKARHSLAIYKTRAEIENDKK
jgi:phosphate starvation-inducible PhoH-like protein